MMSQWKEISQADRDQIATAFRSMKGGMVTTVPAVAPLWKTELMTFAPRPRPTHLRYMGATYRRKPMLTGSGEKR